MQHFTKSDVWILHLGRSISAQSQGYEAFFSASESALSRWSCQRLKRYGYVGDFSRVKALNKRLRSVNSGTDSPVVWLHHMTGVTKGHMQVQCMQRLLCSTLCEGYSCGGGWGGNTMYLFSGRDFFGAMWTQTRTVDTRTFQLRQEELPFVWVECKHLTGKPQEDGLFPVSGDVSFKWTLSLELPLAFSKAQHWVSSHTAALCVTIAWRQRGHEVSSVDHWYSSPSLEDIYFASRLTLGPLPLRHLRFRRALGHRGAVQPNVKLFSPEATGLQLNCWLSSASSSQSHNRLLSEYDFVCLSIPGLSIHVLHRCFYRNRI